MVPQLREFQIPVVRGFHALRTRQFTLSRLERGGPGLGKSPLFEKMQAVPIAIVGQRSDQHRLSGRKRAGNDPSIKANSHCSRWSRQMTESIQKIPSHRVGPRAASSLIELVVVVAIIGVLASLSIPAI